MTILIGLQVIGVSLVLLAIEEARALAAPVSTRDTVEVSAAGYRWPASREEATAALPERYQRLLSSASEGSAWLLIEGFGSWSPIVDPRIGAGKAIESRTVTELADFVGDSSRYVPELGRTDPPVVLFALYENADSLLLWIDTRGGVIFDINGSGIYRCIGTGHRRLAETIVQVFPSSNRARELYNRVVEGEP